MNGMWSGHGAAQRYLNTQGHPPTSHHPQSTQQFEQSLFIGETRVSWCRQQCYAARPELDSIHSDACVGRRAALLRSTAFPSRRRRRQGDLRHHFLRSSWMILKGEDMHAVPAMGQGWLLRPMAKTLIDGIWKDLRPTTFDSHWAFLREWQANRFKWQPH